MILLFRDQAKFNSKDLQMTKEEIQLELTKIILNVKKMEIAGYVDNAIEPVVNLYKKVGELLDSPKHQDNNKPLKA